ncbi:hypothetical protein HDU98_000755 [Podochytrium sp. JEL0797]|nr:hypothetical protein HDU98_000755 [Podochytrium sp. JEL0797]
MKFYELVFSHTATDQHFYGGPNGWKTHLSLLHKDIPVEIEPVTHHDLKFKLTQERGGQRTTSPAVELEDGSLLCGAFAIAEHLEKTYPERPSLFSGSKSSHPDAVQAGKAYARMMDLGLGDSDSQWAVWLELALPSMADRVTPGPNRDYFTSDAKWGPNGFQNMISSATPAETLARAKWNVWPIVQALKERPGEFLQGQEPGFVDYVVFGRYAMCRNCCPGLAKQAWEDQGEEIGLWVERIVSRYPSIRAHLRAYE